MRPGGIREDGFSIIWAGAVKHFGRTTADLRVEQKARPLVDGWCAPSWSVLGSRHK